MKILIADDEEVVRDSVSGILSMRGHSCKVARDGEEALSLFLEDKYDLAVIDFKMPDMDGIELLKKIHAINPDMKVIIFTGYADMESAIDAVNNGAFKYLRKSLDRNKFLSIIRQMEVEQKR